MRPPTAILILLPFALTSPLTSPLDTRASTTCSACDYRLGYNNCDVTTVCVSLGSQDLDVCACRAGYRASGADPEDTNTQWRLPTSGPKGRVYVAPGVVCNTLCDEWQLGPDGCQEVGLVECHGLEDERISIELTR